MYKFYAKYFQKSIFKCVTQYFMVLSHAVLASNQPSYKNYPTRAAKIYSIE